MERYGVICIMKRCRSFHGKVGIQYSTIVQGWIKVKPVQMSTYHELELNPRDGKTGLGNVTSQNEPKLDITHRIIQECEQQKNIT